MNRSVFALLSILVCMIGLSIADGTAQGEPPGPPPDIKVVLSLDKATYYPEDPIMVNLGLVNEGVDEIVRKEWPDTEFWLLLQFFDEKGNIITADVKRGSTTPFPSPPRVFPDETGVLIQGTLVELLTSDWFISFDPYDAYTYYPLEGRSGLFRVKAVVPAITFQRYEETPSHVKYAPRYPTDTTKWHGSLESEFVSFTKVDDADGDGYYYPLAHGEYPEVDCDDRDASVSPGMDEIPGNGKDDDCNPATPDVVAVGAGTIIVKAIKFKLSWGTWPWVTKEPIVGLPVKVFDKTEGSCVAEHRIFWYRYESIWEECSENGFGATNSSGVVELRMPPGDYLVLGKYEPSSGDPIYIGRIVNDLQSGQTVRRYLWVIETATGKVFPTNCFWLMGSELMIIQPEYVEWDGKEELYPFVFESEGDWTVTTSVDPPKGFVADRESLTEDVKTELKAVQFTITDVGSKWKPTKVKYKIKHKGKTEKIESKIDVKLSKKLAKEKGVSGLGKDLEKGSSRK